MVLIKFHPLCYVHVFLFGMCLARLRERYKAELASERAEAQERANALAAPSPTMDGSRSRPAPRGGGCLSVVVGICLNWGCLLGYAGLLLVFCTPAIKPFAYKLSVRPSQPGRPSPSPSQSRFPLRVPQSQPPFQHYQPLPSHPVSPYPPPGASLDLDALPEPHPPRLLAPPAKGRAGAKGQATH